ncbi:hypothetical protein S40285_10135 [Stachybotrys chlorohalonatus IBT 40285]|uniref:Uncharacterized protein n=1 Tax=Stachybotrys chlorohalonatus (strain IBT 40285) TaxID=1283841 RepID=A0A084QQ35_STAC4|nr:hypothetical protein S40285_10135 [Stachybotrys chlorohalonata IBT 40285]
MAHLELGRVAVTAHRLAKEREAHTHTHVFCAPPDAAGAGAEEGKRNSACTLLQRTGTRGFKGGLLPPRLGPSHRAKERRASLPAAERHGKLAIRGAATCAALAARPLHAACARPLAFARKSRSDDQRAAPSKTGRGDSGIFMIHAAGSVIDMGL